MPLSAGLRGVYAITDPALCAKRGLVASVQGALRGGAALVQYRNKQAGAAQRHEEAASLLAACRAHRVPLIINDDIGLAASIGADGVHLGMDDSHISAARARLGTDAIIGVSCYASLESARRAQADGADYVAFGSFFASLTKPAAVRAPLQLLRDARTEFRIPLAAIGGITADNGEALVAGGADLLAVISAIFGAGDPETATRRIAGLFQKNK